MENVKKKTNRNKTLEILENEKESLKNKIIDINKINKDFDFKNNIINGDIIDVLEKIPDNFANLIIVDPPYNLSKNYNGLKFKAINENNYNIFLNSWFPLLCKKLKNNGSLYMCGDWRCTSSLQRIIETELTIINRITWQREKGRGAKKNWKNGMEDIWFAVKDPNNYYFNVDAVKVRRKVLAPYKIDGIPKDWENTKEGNFRITYPSNFWDDITIPFWSMAENTDHPTQKPEKLIAKLILASSKKNDIILDPFLGSGTTSVVAKKLERNYCGIEINELYCMYAVKRLMQAEKNKEIQGYKDGIFWERNSLKEQKNKK